VVHPKRAVASRRGMPMLDIKCQSLQPDTGVVRRFSTTEILRRGGGSYEGFHCEDVLGKSLR